MKSAWFTLAVMAVVALAALLLACGGGGSDERPAPHPQVDCKVKPEACK